MYTVPFESQYHHDYNAEKWSTLISCRHGYEARGHEAEAKPKLSLNHEAEAEAEALTFWNHEAEAEALTFWNHEAEAEAEAQMFSSYFEAFMKHFLNLN